MRVSWLNLHLWIPQRDVRKLIYGLLNKCDRAMVECAHFSQKPIDKGLPKVCVKYGYMSLLKWAVDHNGCIFGDVAIGKAVKYNRIELIPSTVNNGYYCTVAARHGHLKMLQLLDKRGCKINPQVIGVAAALNGHVHILDWICFIKGLTFDDVFDFPHSVYKYCTNNGNTGVVQWMNNHGYIPE